MIALMLMFLPVFWGCQKGGNNQIPPKAVNGVIDLSGWDLVRDGPIALSGEWEFYWNQHLGPEDFSEPGSVKQPNLMNLPGCWNGYLHLRRPLPGMGYATYRLRVLMNNQKGLLALNQLDIATAFTVYANGERIGAAGHTGQSADQSVPGSPKQTMSLKPRGWAPAVF